MALVPAPPPGFPPPPLPLLLETRYVFVAPGQCSECARGVDARAACAGCDSELCFHCFYRALLQGRGLVMCGCGVHWGGGPMSRWDCEGFGEHWLFRLGYRSWAEAEEEGNISNIYIWSSHTRGRPAHPHGPRTLAPPARTRELPTHTHMRDGEA